MEEEIKMIKKNNTWKLVNYPHGKDIIGVKWLCKTKLNPNGTILRHKGRLVAKGYSQQLGVHNNEIFAPVARHKTKLQIFSQRCYQDQYLNDCELCLELWNLHQGGLLKCNVNSRRI